MFPLSHASKSFLFGPSLLTVLTDLSLLTNLKVLLDVGDAASFTSGQSWLDRSGAGIDFFRGPDASPSSEDPGFVGIVGGLSESEFWSFNNIRFFRYDTTNETWMNNLHKNNAKFTLICMHWRPGGSNTQGIAGTHDAIETDVGFGWDISGTSGFQRVTINKGETGAALSQITSVTSFTGNRWDMAALVIDEAAGAGGSFFYRNGDFDQVSGPSDTFDGTYTSPSDGSATHTMEIMAMGNKKNIWKFPGRAAWFAAWEGVVLSKTNLDDIWTNVRGRFGI